MMTDPHPQNHDQPRDDPQPDDLLPYPPDEELTTELIEDVSFDDRTPYAHARESGQRGYLKMCRWVWTAGKYRLTHLCLSRPSPHSRRFARKHVLLFSVVAALCIFANAGWHQVRVGPGMEGVPKTPEGKGWSEVVTRPFPTPTTFAESVVVSSVWLNATWASFAAGIGLAIAVVFGFLLLWLYGSLARRSLLPEHRIESRIRCAIHYGTCWLLFLTASLLVLCLRPLTVLGKVGGWTFVPSTIVVDACAILLAIGGIMLGWFWLIRLGGTVPKGSRRSASRFFVIWGPFYMAVLLGGIGYGLYFLSVHLPERLSLSW